MSSVSSHLTGGKGFVNAYCDSTKRANIWRLAIVDDLDDRSRGSLYEYICLALRNIHADSN